ncbi:MAG: hypothetical protein V4692_03750, partial [Bdellovibrionota bacterium]
MSWIIVIEENPGVLIEVKEALTQIDPKIEVVNFDNSSGFLDWMVKLQDHDPEIAPPLPKDKFLGIVTSIESWKFKDVKLIGKFKALFVQKGLAPTEEELCVVFTGYETPSFQKKRFEYRSVNNFIFKPFDKVVLKQMLEIALNGRQKIKNHYTHVLKSDAHIEMLKEIRLTGLNELGFQTTSDQPIETGKTAKYYAGFLETGQHRSALAQVLSFEHPEGKAQAEVRLRFFALDQQQSFNVQKLAQRDKTTRPLAGTPAAPEIYEFIFVQHESSALCQDLQPSVERFFDHPVTSLTSLIELDHALKAASTNAAKKRFVFVDIAHFNGDVSGGLDTLIASDADKKLAFFVLSPRILSEQIEMELTSKCEDIFYAPFNRSYIVKGLKQRWPDLNNKEEIYESFQETEQLIHVSNRVKLVEVSEAGLILEYHREVSIGGFREFVLWMPNETQVPTLLAQCNFTQRSEDGKSFHCHFIFFG